MHARDIPVVGGLLDTVLVFSETLARIARHPFGFVHTIPFDDPQEPRRAFKFIGAGIALAYLILTPAMSRHGYQVGELLFGAVVLLRLLLVVLLYHLAFLVVGCRRPAMTSLILGAYINGLYFPFFIAVMLPAYLVIGPQPYFDPLFQPQLTPQQLAALDEPLVRIAQIAFFIGYPIFFAVAAYWWAKAFGTRLWVSVVLLLMVIVTAAMANIHVFSHLLRPFL
jgi:hypothetical protein